MIEVFISSPVDSLKKERQAVKEAILELPGMNPVLSEETMTAQSRPSKDACEKAVAGCDIYILLLGGKYGYEFEDNLSVTHFEFNTARRLDKPILVFNLPGKKEEKQENFAKLVGNFITGFFWKSILKKNLIFDLQTEVKKAVVKILEDRIKDKEIPKDIRFADVPWEFFIERPEVVDSITGMLASDSSRLITLTGIGGIGKTAISNEIARQQMKGGNFPDGIYILLCENILSSQVLFGEILSKLEIEQGELKTAKELANRVKDKRMLVILDNFENLLNEDNEAANKFIEELIHYSRLPKFLITSRETSLINEEIVFEIPGMNPEEASALFYSVAKKNGAIINSKDIDVIGSLITEMDGMPLAIILCASQLDTAVSAGNLLKSWNEEKNKILTKPGQKEGRLNSVDFSLNLSFNRLNDEERLLLCILSLFTGAATEESLRTVYDKPVSNTRAALIRRHLAYVREGRTKLLVPVSQFAGAKWKTGQDRISYTKRFAEYFEEQIGIWYNDWFNNKGGIVLPLFISEYENVFNTGLLLFNAKEKKLYIELISMAYYSSVLWDWAGLTRRGIELLKLGVESAKEIKDKSGEANCYKSLGDLYLRISDIDKAKIEFERALPLFREVGSKLGEANCYSGLGDLYFMISDNNKAKIEFERALPLYREVGSKLGEANCYRSLGYLYFRISDNDKAKIEFERTLPLYREVGDKLGEANCYKSLGNLYFRISDNDKAKIEFECALPLFREVGDKLGEANCYYGLGDLYFSISDDKAKIEFERALPLYREVGNKLGESNCDYSLGIYKIRINEEKEGIALIEKAIKYYESIPNYSNIAEAFDNMAEEVKNIPKGTKKEWFERAAEYYSKAGNKVYAERCKNKSNAL